jgi:hypothetical protein
MATLSTFQKFKEEQEKKKQGGQQSNQQSTQQSGQKSTGLMNSYQQFMAKQQGQETAYTPESDYGQRVMDVIGKVGNSAASRNGEWTADASGGNAAEINALLREYDAYTGDKSGMTEYRNALLDYNKRIQAENQYYAGFGTKDDFNRVRSGYTNFGVGYDPRSYELDDASARKLRQESAQNDAKEAQRALAELNSARKNFAAVDSEWRAMDERYRSFTIDEYDKDLTQRWQAAKDQVTAAENALLNSRNRMDAYNATWGKVDKYGETSEAAKGTDTSYTGPGYESIADWENKKNEELAAQDAQAQRADYVPGTLRYTSDTEPVAEDRLGLWRSLTPEQKQDAVNSSNVQLNNVVMAGNDGHWDLLTDNEVETYYYIKGQQGQEAANQYLDDMYIELSRRNELKTVQSIENANSWEKAGLTAVSVGANLVGAIPAALGKTADMVAGRTNPYSSMQFFQRYASYIRGSVGQDIGDWTESKLADKFGEQFAAKAGELANQTFQAFMSGVDSFAGGMTFGQGLALPAGPFNFHVGGYTTVMGMGAFAQRAQEMELKGATPTQIAIGSIGSGILEALFEDVSMEAFFTNILDNPAKTAGEFVKKLAIQMGVEGSEEMFTEMGNIILDAINMGKNSENSMAVREYMAQGMTEEKARQQVWKDNAVDILWAGYGGAISAGAMAAGGQLATDTVRKASNTIGNYSVGDTLTKNGRYVDLQEQANALQDQKKSTKLSKAAQEVAQKASAGDESIGNKYRMGKVASQIAKQAGREANKAETTEFRNAAEKYLSERRDIQDKKRALNVLTRAYDGTTIPGDSAAMRRWGNQMTREILEGIGGKQTLQENAKARAASAIQTAVDVQSSVLGFEPTRGETAFEYNQEGDTQAYLKDSSDPVNIRAEDPVAKIENGKMWLNTDDGQTVEADNVSFGTAEDAELASVVSRMNITADQANSLYAARTASGMSAKSYATALQNAYLKGFSGVTYNGIQDYSAAAKLPGDVRRTAWEAGRQMRNRQTTQQAARISKGTQMVNQRGLTFRDSAKAIRNLNEQQKTGIAAAKALAAAGLNIEVYASTEAERANGAPNGFYRSSDGTIHIDLNAGDNGQGTVAYVVAHEATHFIKDLSADKYQIYADILIEAAENKGISYDSLLDRQLAKLSALEENRGKTAEELQKLAYDETIAEMSETMLTDTDAVRRVSQELYKKDRTLWEKIRDFFTGLVEKLRSAYKGLDPDSDMGRITRQAIRDNEKVAQAWAEALVEAGENYQLQDGQKNNAREGVRLSLRGKTQQELTANFQAEVDNVLDNPYTSGKQLIVGYTPSLYESLGMPSLPLTIGSGHVYSAAKTEAQAKQDGNFHKGVHYHGLGNAAVKNIYSAIQDPIMVIAAKDVNKNASPLRSTHSVVAIVDIGTAQKSLLVPIEITAERKVNGTQMDVNTISSIYEKSVGNLVNEAIALENSGDVGIFYAKKEATALPVAGVQFPAQLQQPIASNGIVHRLSEKVNMKVSEATQSQQFKRWFGDWQNDPANASKVVNEDGTPKVLYHQTSADFTIFEPRHEGAGTRDQDTPFGIFMKSSDRNIGVKGERQMALYARIVNPLRVTDRADLMYQLKKISPEYEKVSAELRSLNDEYQQKYDDAKEAFRDYVTKWRQKNPNASRTAIYDDAAFNEVYEAEDNVLDEWEAEARKVELRSKEAITRDLEKQGYDGVIIRTDEGSFGRSTDAYIALRPEQVKSATDNVGTFDKSNPDIRYSDRNSGESRVDRLVRKNEELKAEAEYLKQVVQIQKQGNRKNLRDRESVNAIAKGILESVNAKDTEFGKKLNDFYRDLVTVEMDYDTMQEKAGELADRALEHHQAERDGYAQEVLDFLKKRRVSLSDGQIGDIEYTYGSLNEFKKAIRGSIILDQNSTTSLDQLWQEAAARFPDRFGADTTEADMPDGIANIVSWANSAEADSETELQYYKAETKADLTQRILMGFLDAKPIESVSDTLKQQLADLKQQHKQEMKELRRSWDEEAKAMERSHKYDLEAERKRGKAAVEALKYQQEVIQKAQEGLWETERADIKRSYEKQMKELKEQNTQKAHEKVESRHRTEERHKLQNTIDTLNRMLLRPTNTAHVPQELQSSVAMAMKVINGVILDSKTGQNAGRLAKYAEQLRKLEGNPEDNAEKIADLNRKIGDLTGRDISMKAALTSLQEQYAKLEGQDGGLYDSNIEALIEDAKETIGNTAYKDLSLKQLKAVRDTYTALLTTIRNANKAFVAGQNARIDDMVKRATIELSMKGKKKPTQTAIGKKADQFFWNNEKPVYAFERIGSAVMSELYRNLRNGEDTFYRDVNSAREFFLGAAEKDGFDKWNLDELQEFEASNGQKFQLSLDERMSLYAYSLRPQARDHLTKGGIVLAENTRRLQQGPLGVTREVTYDDANAYTLTDETIDAIVGSLTKEQRQFAYEMQQYLAKVMGAKGDEVNMAMYGIKKFGEETYWPLKSSGVFSERIREQQERTGNKVKNSGFTKALTQHANNAIELSSLTETWAQHVNDMSMYHAFTLPMEDFYRVYNWMQKGDSKGKQTMGVRQMIQQTAGKGAVTYIDQFLKDLNGGLRADPRETVSKAMLSGFKKAAVSASLSVAIQQPSAVGRALAYIEANYFLGSKVESAGGIKATWDQLKKYAAVAGLKEMGRFDVDMGQSTLEYIIGRHSVNAWGKFKDKVDEYSGWLPEIADQVTWCGIWEAAKRKTAAQNPGLKGEALLQKAGELFTDTITRTQVYDSVFSRSANMRAKSGLMSMATAFMAEPTTTANMVEDAVRKFAGGDKRMAGKVMSSVAVATVLNAALASVVYAARDDDDDKTYWEKYMASLAGETVDSLNPLTYIPVLSDINNLLLGYSIERTDMSLASDLITALKKITTLYGKYDDEWSDEKKKEWKKKVRDAWLDNAWMAGTVMGLPLKNVVRDVEAVINTARNHSNGAEMSADTVLKAMGDSARKNFPILSWKADESSSDQLYKAITQGKDVLARRLKAQFGDEKKYESALLKGLRENDPRIKTAAQYAIDGNTPKRVAIIREIVAEGHYTQNQVIKAINQKANSMKEKTQSGKESPPEKLYDYSEYVNAAANGLGYAGDVQKELIRYQADRNQEADGKLTRQEAESDALKTFQSNVKSDAKDGYAAGELTEAQVRKVLTAADIAEGEELDDLMLQWDTEVELGREIDWGDTKYREYAEEIRPAGISVDVYDEWLRQVNYHLTGVDEDGDGKADRNSAVKQKAAYINSLPLTAEQKEALWRTVSTSARTLRKYRLW